MDEAAQAARLICADWDQNCVEVKPSPEFAKLHKGRPVGRYRPLAAVVEQIAAAIREGERRGREQALAERRDCDLCGEVAVEWDDGRLGGEGGQ
jgi:hypothetical protein